jgi:hypothetical protein
MTQDEIIKLAQKCGDWNGETIEMNDVGLERFAALVAAAEREACLDAMMQSTAKAVDTAMALEREACAKVCLSEWSTLGQRDAGGVFAAAIRARGNT